jgi:hypothetical protein
VKNCKLIPYLVLASAVTTFSNSVAVGTDTFGKSNLIAQSRRQYECSEMESSLAYQVQYTGMDIALSLYQQENVLPIEILLVLVILLQVDLQA